MSKSRLQGKRKNYNEDSEDDEEEEQEEFSKKPLIKKNRTKINRTIDNSDEENEGPENIQQADEDVKDPKGYSYEAGHILRIYCQDFMNHRKFDIKLGHHMNFITGKNGSGKSALVHALQLGLGSNANETGRGKKIETFIREGSEGPAIIKITLLNTGPDAYKPNEYGKKITIMRKIFKRSASTYHILNESDKEVTNSKSDLQNMLRGFSIFVDTPCCILTQDIAKKLINDYTAKDKFDFFCRATGLSQLEKDLGTSNDNLIVMGEELENFKPKIKETKALLKEWEDKLFRYQELGTVEKQIKECDAKTYWCDLNTYVEENVERIEEDFNLKTEEVNKAKANLDKEFTEDPELQEKLNQLNNDFQRIQAEEDEVMLKLNSIQQEVADATREVTTCTNSVKNIQNTRDDYAARLKNVTQEIKDMRQKSLQYAEDGERDAIKRIDNCENEIARLRDDEQKIIEDGKSENLRLIDNRSTRENATRNLNSIEYQMRTISDEIKNLSNSKSKVSLFGGYKVEQVVNQIKKTKFRNIVYGPLGVHINIKDGFHQWNRAISKAIGGSFNSFVVTCREDQDILGNIIRSIDKNLANSITIILQPPHARYNINKLPNRDGVLVTDTLVIESDDVFNALVDMTGMDRIAFTTDEDTFKSEYLGYNHNIKCIKYNLTSVILEVGTQIGIRQGNMSYDMLRDHHFKDLGKDVASSIAEKQMQLKAIEITFHESKQEILRSDELIKQINAGLQQIERAKNQNVNAIAKAHQQKKALQEKLAEIKDLNEIDTADKEQEQADLEKAIDDMKDEFDRRNLSVTTAKAELKAKTNAKKDIENQRNTFTNQLEDITGSIEKIIEKQRNFRKEKDKVKKKFDNLQKEYDVLIKEHEKIKHKEAELLERAQEKSRELIENWNGEPLPLIITAKKKETKASLQKKIKELAYNLEEGKKEANLLGYTEAFLNEKFGFYKAKFDDEKKLYSDLRKRQDELENILTEQHEKFSNEVRHNIEVVQKRFDEYLQKQGGSGTLNFNIETKEMTFEVQMDNTDKNTKTNEVKNLSGGERSFITLCWLIGLGFVIESPFRLMDEYDVFMDEARRNSTLEFLIDYSERSDMRSRQFIISTPNNLKAVKTGSGEWVKIHKMPDPIRNTAHGLQQQTID